MKKIKVLLLGLLLLQTSVFARVTPYKDDSEANRIDIFANYLSRGKTVAQAVSDVGPTGNFTFFFKSKNSTTDTEYDVSSVDLTSTGITSFEIQPGAILTGNGTITLNNTFIDTPVSNNVFSSSITVVGTISNVVASPLWFDSTGSTTKVLNAVSRNFTEIVGDFIFVREASSSTITGVSGKVIKIDPTGDGYLYVASDMSIGSNKDPDVMNPSANNLILGSNSSDSGITIISAATKEGKLAFADGETASAENAGYIQYNHSTDTMLLGVANTDIVTVNSTGMTVSGSISATTLTSSGLIDAQSALKIKENSNTFIDLVKSTDVTIYSLLEDGSSGLKWNNGSSDVYFMDSAGNVGIGESSPSTYGSLVITRDTGNNILRIRDDGHNHASLGHIDGNGGFVSLLNEAGTEAIALRSYSDSDFKTDNNYNFYQTGGASLALAIQASGNLNAPGLGSGTGTNLIVDASGNIEKDTSSVRYKKNVVDLGIDSAKLYDLRPVEYDRKDEEKHEFGLIAEEVEELFPEIVTYDSEGLAESIRYDRLSVLLIAEIQKLNERIKVLERI